MLMPQLLNILHRQHAVRNIVARVDAVRVLMPPKMPRPRPPPAISHAAGPRVIRYPGVPPKITPHSPFGDYHCSATMRRSAQYASVMPARCRPFASCPAPN